MKGNGFLLTLALTLLPSGFTQAQSAPAAQSAPKDQQPATQSFKPSKGKALTGESSAPLVLEDTGPASTESAAASAARDLARRKDAEVKDRVGGHDKNQARGGSAPASKDGVVEFHVTPPGSGLEKGLAPVNSKDGRQAARRVHGESYGAAGTGGQAAAESAGVTSKDRKTSVYVGSDQIRSEPAQSH